MKKYFITSKTIIPELSEYVVNRYEWARLYIYHVPEEDALVHALKGAHILKHGTQSTNALLSLLERDAYIL